MGDMGVAQNHQPYSLLIYHLKGCFLVPWLSHSDISIDRNKNLVRVLYELDATIWRGETCFEGFHQQKTRVCIFEGALGLEMSEERRLLI